MLIILLTFALIRTLYGVPLSTPSESPDGFLDLDLRDTQTHFGQRTVNDIIISCFATIFACTWSAIHPNIPAPTDCWWTRYKRQVTTMIYALLAPEFMTVWALRQRLAARIIADKYNRETIKCGNETAESNDTTKHSLLRRLFQDSLLPPEFMNGKGPQWTLSHGFFLQMGGFMLCENGRPIQTLTDRTSEAEETSIGWNIQKGIIDPPRIAEEDIQDRSKGDAISKTLIILQTTWFIAQCIARWSQHLPITELELVTLAFSMLNGVTYGLWWNKPQNVGRPMFLEIKKPRYDSNTILVEPSTGSSHLEGISHPSDVRSLLIPPHPQPTKKQWLRRKLRQDFDELGCACIAFFFVVPPRLIGATLRILDKMYGDDKAPGCGDMRVGMFFADYSESDPNKFDMAIPLGVIGTAFGSIHLIPSWFLEFSSRQEMWLWRISAIIVTGEPFFAIIAILLNASDYEDSLLCQIFVWHAIIGLPFYIVSRIILLILSLLSLRSLPPAALQTIQ